MSHSLPSVTLSVRISPTMQAQLEKLAVGMGRSKSFVASEALAQYVENQLWQIEAVQDAVQKADAPDATFIEHEEVRAWAKSL